MLEVWWGDSGPQVSSWQMRSALVAAPGNWESKSLCSVGLLLDFRGTRVLSSKSMRWARVVEEDPVLSKGTCSPDFVSHG